MRSTFSVLEDIENATMHLKVSLKAKDIKTAQEWHSKLESLTQELYSTELWQDDSTS